MKELYLIVAGLFLVMMIGQYVQTRSLEVTLHGALRQSGYIVIVLVVNYFYNLYVQRLGYCPLGTWNPAVMVTLGAALLAGFFLNFLFSFFPRLFVTEKGLYLMGWNEEMISRRKYRSITLMKDKHYLLTPHEQSARPKKLWLPRGAETIYSQVKNYLEEA